MYRQRLLRNIVNTESQISRSTVSTYRERSSDETDSDDGNEEESGIFNENDDSFKKQSSSRETDNNDEDEKEQLITGIRQVVIETRVNIKLDNRTIKTREHRIEFITSLVETSITNVITLKVVHSNFFFEESIKMRIFI